MPVRQLGSFNRRIETLATEAADQMSDEVRESFSRTPQSPLSVLDTVSGFSLAEDALGRIE